MKINSLLVLVASLVWLFSLPAHAAAPTLTVQVDQPGARISPTLFGVFFEDINFGGDGGIYPELVKNRSFEFTEPLMGWQPLAGHARGSMAVLSLEPLNANNPQFLRVKADDAESGFGVANEGFRGMGVRQGETYRFSVFIRQPASAPLTLQMELVSPAGAVLGSAQLGNFDAKWQRYTTTLRSSATEPKARLHLIVRGPGRLDLDMISLFPKATWKKRPNGLRADLVQLLKDMQPGFVRFPGGCIVEGRDLANRYQWKNTIGDVAERKLIINRWNNEFKHRPTPDYFQSFGLGFFEYFQLCEDIGAEPLPILNCGMACQFNTAELVPMAQLDPYIQDALDLIEFANGPAKSVWGSKRAAMGHPAPFNLKMLGVGNEQWGPQYIERYTQFAQALKAKYPSLLLISSAGPSPADERFKFAWEKLRALNAEIVDEHCYDKPAWFYQSATRYDNYDRRGPKVFMGEYAAQSVATCSPENRNNWECALSEAAFMTGLERNADVVRLSSYAPLFGHEEGWQWRPNLMWFDNLKAYGTPNYYVQQLFSRNRGEVVLPVKIAAELAAGQAPELFASASRRDKSGEIILKVVNASPQPSNVQLRFPGIKKAARTASVTVLAGTRLDDVNSLTEPNKVAPVEETFPGAGESFAYAFKPQSLTILRIKAGK